MVDKAGLMLQRFILQRAVPVAEVITPLQGCGCKSCGKGKTLAWASQPLTPYKPVWSKTAKQPAP